MYMYTLKHGTNCLKKCIVLHLYKLNNRGKYYFLFVNAIMVLQKMGLCVNNMYACIITYMYTLKYDSICLKIHCTLFIFE